MNVALKTGQFSNGLQALDRLQTDGEIAIVLTDINMNIRWNKRCSDFARCLWRILSST